MDAKTQEILTWIAGQRDTMLTRVVQWAEINSYTRNIAGLANLTKKVAADFSVLGGEIALHDLPPAGAIGPRGQNIQIPLGQAIVIDKRPDSSIRVLLNIHLDTVYPPDSSFLTVTLEGDRVRGPGVYQRRGACDPAKGLRTGRLGGIGSIPMTYGLTHSDENGRSGKQGHLNSDPCFFCRELRRNSFSFASTKSRSVGAPRGRSLFM